MTHKMIETEKFRELLWALEYAASRIEKVDFDFEPEITAIKEALMSQSDGAQPEQRSVSEHLEPVAWMYPDALCDRSCLYVCTKVPECATTPYVATPRPQRKPLTDEQIVPMFRAREKMKVLGEKDAWFWYAWGIGDAEAAHGITKE